MTANIVINVSGRDLEIPAVYGGGSFAVNTKILINDEQGAICEAFKSNTAELTFVGVSEDKKYRVQDNMPELSLVGHASTTRTPLAGEQPHTGSNSGARLAARLTELEATFIALEPDGSICKDAPHKDGVQFLCPACFAKNGGPIGTHLVLCWFSNADGSVAADVKPGPGRWIRVGNTIDTLTLDGAPSKSRSVLLTSGCNAHFHITNGVVQPA